jgi:DNA primase
MRPLPSAYKKSLEHATSLYEKEIDRAWDYLAVRGLDLATAREFRLGVVNDPASGHESMHGRLAIPSIGANGVYQIKFRCMDNHSCKDLGHSKYLTDAVDNRLYNLRAVAVDTSRICISEGEIDAITLEQIGHPAVACPGSNTWRRHHARIFAGFEEVYIFGDGDKAGRDFAKSLSLAIPRAVRVALPDNEDVNSLYVKSGADAINELMGV